MTAEEKLIHFFFFSSGIHISCTVYTFLTSYNLTSMLLSHLKIYPTHILLYFNSQKSNVIIYTVSLLVFDNLSETKKPNITFLNSTYCL